MIVIMKVSTAQNLQYFQDLNTSLGLGKNQADQRLQVKMPRRVVVELARLFPHTDRSFILTQLATNAITEKLRFQDRKILQSQATSEQEGLDDMVSYLEDRDADKI